MREPKVALALAVTLVLWASAFPLIRVALKGLGPGHLALVRFGTACVVLWALVAFEGLRTGKWPRVAKADWGLMIAGGALGTTAYHALLNWGEQSIAAGPASFLIATAPMWGLLLAPLAGERAPRGVWGGVLVALAGVFLLSWGQNASPPIASSAAPGAIASPSAIAAASTSPASGLSALLNPAALLILGAACAGGASGVIYRKLLARGVGELPLSAITTLIGTAFLLPFAPGLVTSVQSAPRAAVLSAIYLGVFPTAIAYLAWTFALKRAGLMAVLPFIYLIPVLASLMAFIGLHEVPATLSLLGGAIVLAGVTAAQAAGRRTKAS